MVPIRGYKPLALSLAGVTTTKTLINLGELPGGGITCKLRVKNTGLDAGLLYLDGSAVGIPIAAGEVFSEPVEVRKFELAAATTSTDFSVLAMISPEGTVAR